MFEANNLPILLLSGFIILIVFIRIDENYKDYLRLNCNTP